MVHDKISQKIRNKRTFFQPDKDHLEKSATNAYLMMKDQMLSL